MAEPAGGVLPGDVRVVVVGGGIAGLVAALECARLGVRVTVLEASERLGGCVRTEEVAGIAVDTGAESFATRGGTVRTLVDRLGLADRVIAPEPAGAWLQLADRAVPLPKAGILGIPANPFAEDVRAVIGWRGAWRAYLDRIRPVLTIGQEHNLGALVERRMGKAVLDDLVAPVTSGVYSAEPSQLDVSLAAPGLNRALTVAGSLSGAVTTLRDEAPAGSAVGGFRGGMRVLVEALEEQLAAFGADIVLGASAHELSREGDDAVRWTVSGVRAAADGASAEPDAPEEPEPFSLEADAVIVAVPERAALGLLSPHVPAVAAEEPADAPAVEIVTLVVDSPELDARPRGSGVLTTAAAGRTAKALTHSTAKWAWLAEEAAAEHGHRHVVRVSFGRQGQAGATEGLDDDAVAELALREASALLGVELTPSALVGVLRTPWTGTLPRAFIGQRDRAGRLRDAVTAVEGLDVTGAWLSGTGLASVIPDATEAAARVRHRVVAEVLGLDDERTDRPAEA